MTIDSSGNSGVDTRGRCAMLAANAMSAAPPLSVILTCQNPGSRLPETLASVWEQRGVQPDLIVIDRSSTDGTTPWLAARERIKTLVVAPDTSSAEALNEGIAAAQGEWVLLIGPRDRLVGDTVLSETLNWMKKTEAGVVAGEAASDDGALHKLRSRVNPIAGDFTPRSATFYRRSLFAENGRFDAAFGAMARYEFNLRLWKNRVRFKPIPLRITACAPGERFDWPACRQEIRARHLYFSAGRCVAWDAWALVRCVKSGRRSSRSA